MIKKIDVTAGNWIRFRVYRREGETFSGVVGYHPGKADLECTCNLYKPGKPCSHVEWLAREFTYDKTFEDIRALIMKEAGVDYSYTVIEDLWDKCLKVTNVRLYESFKKGASIEKNPLLFKLEREGSFGVDTSSRKDQTPIGWQGRIPGSDQEWIVEQTQRNIFFVRMLPMSKQNTPWRIVERNENDEWKSNCACYENRACVHELAAKMAFASWVRNGMVRKKTDEARGTYATVESVRKLEFDFQREFIDELASSLIGDKFVSTSIDPSKIKEEWTYMGPTAWGTKVFSEPYMKEEKQEPKPTEEPKPPPKPKNRFSKMEL